MNGTTPRGRSKLARCGALACVAAAMLVTGCGSSAPAVPTGTLIGVTESDFLVSATTSHVKAGDVVLRIHNNGPDEHELIVAPLSLSRVSPHSVARSMGVGGLPLRLDGFTINEEAIQKSEPGSITPQHPGGTEYLKLHLARGRYVLFCNMEGHFMAGMSTILVVT